MPTEDIVTNFNDLRQDIVLLYELKLALANCEYEMQTLRHRFETLAPGKVMPLIL
jgi:DNA methyltransferase 1-associated protein 1